MGTSGDVDDDGNDDGKDGSDDGSDSLSLPFTRVDSRAADGAFLFSVKGGNSAHARRKNDNDGDILQHTR